MVSWSASPRVVFAVARPWGTEGSLVSSRSAWIVAAAVLAGAGCGDNGNNNTSSSTEWTAGTFAPSSSFAAQCATPRTGTDPATGRAFPDVKGSVTSENNFLRSWTHELYLWYREVPDLHPPSYSPTP